MCALYLCEIITKERKISYQSIHDGGVRWDRSWTVVRKTPGRLYILPYSPDYAPYPILLFSSFFFQITSLLYGAVSSHMNVNSFEYQGHFFFHLYQLLTIIIYARVNSLLRASFHFCLLLSFQCLTCTMIKCKRLHLFAWNQLSMNLYLVFKDSEKFIFMPVKNLVL